MRHFRFPYGRYDPVSLAAVQSRGMTSIQWSVVTGDPDPSRTSKDIIETVLNDTRSGSIVIFHANGRGWNTAAALEECIRGLQDRGFHFLTVSELVSIGKPLISIEAFEEIVGDNERYDNMFY